MRNRGAGGMARDSAISIGRPGLAAGLGLLLASAADAQIIPQQPVAPTREEIRREPAPAEPTGPRLIVEGGAERAPCALDRPDYSEIRFTLTDAAFDGLRGLPPEALRPAFAPYVGQEHPVAIICAIRDRAATILREAGYIASVEVPEQRIADGRIRFQVLMARLVGLRVRGDAGRAERTIAGYLERLTEQEVFNRYTAERYLLLAGDLPGYDVRLALRSAGAARGEVIGEVFVTRTPALVDFTVQNYGSRALGRWGGLLRAQILGLTGLGDRTSLAAFSTADTSEQQTLQIGHDFRIGSEGLAIAGQLTYAWASPDLGDPLIDIDSRTLFATIEANYPLVRRQALTVRGGIGLDVVNQAVDFNSLPLSSDRVRVAFARLDVGALGLAAGDPRYTLAEPRWRFAASVELRKGLDILNASGRCGPAFVNCTGPGQVPPSRLEGDPLAWVVRGSAHGEFRPTPRLTFSLGARTQYSGVPLVSFEEFSGGNYSEGRGYDPGAILGDNGVGVQAELRYGRTTPSGPRAFAVQPYLFFDQAWVRNEDVFLSAGRQELSSVGGGVRAVYGDRLRLDVALAVPLDRLAGQARRGDPRLLVSLTTRLWPWSSR